MYSKTKIDKCVKNIINESSTAKEKKDSHEIFDFWRKKHIEPLTEITLKLQEWFISDFEKELYIAQRLKRKPQILRKLKRFSTRLTQLQDIGGCRIIVEKNSDVDRLNDIINIRNKKSHYFQTIGVHDYREKGRDDSGYRALHIIVKRKDVFIEIQIRSRIQHYWAESIERTSVISNFLLKELNGPKKILSYFKELSHVLHDIEYGIKIKREIKDSLDLQRLEAERIISKQDTYRILNSHVNEQFIQSMIGKEKSLRKTKISNWMIVFDWKKGEFLHWIHLDKNPNSAIEKYAENEILWPEEDGFEVVLISSSSVITIQETHSHYFGIERFDQILDSLDQAQNILRSMKNLTPESIHVIDKLYTHNFIGNKRVTLDTLKNHICKIHTDIDKELTLLINNDYIFKQFNKDLYSLNKDKIKEIRELLGRE